MTDYGPIDDWVVGAIGRPGERAFYIQFTSGGLAHGYLLEKAQVAALVIEARRLLDATGLTSTPSALAAAELDSTVVPEFRVGEIHLAYREATDRIEVRLVPTADDLDDAEFDLAPSRFAGALADAEAAVRGGRPMCPRCGMAMDPDGHHCPATNGDLRGHRP